MWSPKFFFGLAGLILLIVTLPVGLYLSQHQQTVRSKAYYQCNRVCDTQIVCGGPTCRSCAGDNADDPGCDGDSDHPDICDGPPECHDAQVNCRQECPVAPTEPPNYNIGGQYQGGGSGQGPQTGYTTGQLACDVNDDQDWYFAGCNSYSCGLEHWVCRNDPSQERQTFETDPYGDCLNPQISPACYVAPEYSPTPAVSPVPEFSPAPEFSPEPSPSPSPIAVPLAISSIETLVDGQVTNLNSRTIKLGSNIQIIVHVPAELGQDYACRWNSGDGQGDSAVQDCTLSTTPDIGQHSLSVYLVNQAGETSVTQTISFTVRPPLQITSLQTLVNGQQTEVGSRISYNSGISFTASVVEGLGQDYACRWNYGDGQGDSPPENCTSDSRQFPPGEHSVSVYLVNNAGEQSEPKTVSFTVKPELKILSLSASVNGQSLDTTQGVKQDEPVFFEAQTPPELGQDFACRWNFGDNQGDSPPSDCRISKTFKAGVANVSVYLVNNAGDISERYRLNFAVNATCRAYLVCIVGDDLRYTGRATVSWVRVDEGFRGQQCPSLPQDPSPGEVEDFCGAGELFNENNNRAGFTSTERQVSGANLSYQPVDQPAQCQETVYSKEPDRGFDCSNSRRCFHDVFKSPATGCVELPYYNPSGDFAGKNYHCVADNLCAGTGTGYTGEASGCLPDQTREEIACHNGYRWYNRFKRDNSTGCIWVADTPSFERGEKTTDPACGVSDDEIIATNPGGVRCSSSPDNCQQGRYCEEATGLCRPRGYAAQNAPEGAQCTVDRQCKENFFCDNGTCRSESLRQSVPILSGIGNILGGARDTAGNIANLAGSVAGGLVNYGTENQVAENTGVYLTEVYPEAGRQLLGKVSQLWNAFRNDQTRMREEEEANFNSPECQTWLSEHPEVISPTGRINFRSLYPADSDPCGFRGDTRSAEQRSDEAVNTFRTELNQAGDLSQLGEEERKDAYLKILRDSLTKVQINYAPSEANYLSDMIRTGEVIKLAQSRNLSLDRLEEWDQAQIKYFFDSLARGDINPLNTVVNMALPVDAIRNYGVAEDICRGEAGNACIAGTSGSDFMQDYKEEDLDKANQWILTIDPNAVIADRELTRKYSQIYGAQIQDPLVLNDEARKEERARVLGVSREELDRIHAYYQNLIKHGRFIRTDTSAGRQMVEAREEAAMEVGITVIAVPLLGVGWETPVVVRAFNLGKVMLNDTVIGSLRQTVGREVAENTVRLAQSALEKYQNRVTLNAAEQVAIEEVELAAKLPIGAAKVLAETGGDEKALRRVAGGFNLSNEQIDELVEANTTVRDLFQSQQTAQNPAIAILDNAGYLSGNRDTVAQVLEDANNAGRRLDSDLPPQPVYVIADAAEADLVEPSQNIFQRAWSALTRTSEAMPEQAVPEGAVINNPVIREEVANGVRAGEPVEVLARVGDQAGEVIPADVGQVLDNLASRANNEPLPVVAHNQNVYRNLGEGEHLVIVDPADGRLYQAGEAETPANSRRAIATLSSDDRGILHVDDLVVEGRTNSTIRNAVNASQPENAPEGVVRAQPRSSFDERVAEIASRNPSADDEVVERSVVAVTESAGAVFNPVLVLPRVVADGAQSVRDAIDDAIDNVADNIGGFFSRLGESHPAKVELQPVPVSTGDELVRLSRIQEALQRGDANNPELREFWQGLVRDTDGRFKEYQGKVYKGYYKGPQPNPNLNPDGITYINASIEARKAFLEGLQEGKFNDPDLFRDWVSKLHSKQFYTGNPQNKGVFIDRGGADATAHTPIVRGEVADVASRYQDPYIRFLRNERAPEYPLQLPGISAGNLPRDSHLPKGVIKHSYPPSSGYDEYLTQMQTRLARLQALDKSASLDEQLILIAEIYQYGANARMFEKSTNSLFMNMANGLLAERGLKPIEHGFLDFVAMRLQPDNFAKLFREEVERAQAGITREPGIWDGVVNQGRQIANLAQDTGDNLGARMDDVVDGFRGLFIREPIRSVNPPKIEILDVVSAPRDSGKAAIPQSGQFPFKFEATADKVVTTADSKSYVVGDKYFVNDGRVIVPIRFDDGTVAMTYLSVSEGDFKWFVGVGPDGWFVKSRKGKKIMDVPTELDKVIKRSYSDSRLTRLQVPPDDEGFNKFLGQFGLAHSSAEAEAAQRGLPTVMDRFLGSIGASEKRVNTEDINRVFKSADYSKPTDAVYNRFSNKVDVYFRVNDPQLGPHEIRYTFDLAPNGPRGAVDFTIRPLSDPQLRYTPIYETRNPKVGVPAMVSGDKGIQADQGWDVLSQLGRNSLVGQRIAQITGGFTRPATDGDIGKLLKDLKVTAGTPQAPKPAKVPNIPNRVPARIYDVQNFDQLKVWIDTKGGIQGSQGFYSSQDLNRLIEDVRAGKVQTNAITRNEGLREKVVELIKKEPIPCPIGLNLIPTVYAAENPCPQSNIFQKAADTVKDWFGRRTPLKKAEVDDVVNKVDELLTLEGATKDPGCRAMMCGYSSYLVQHVSQKEGMSADVYQLLDVHGVLSGKSPDAYQHGFTIIEKDNQRYLTDLTFNQFVLENGQLRQARSHDPSGRLLSDFPAVVELLDKGYVPLTDDTLRQYLKASVDAGVNDEYLRRIESITVNDLLSKAHPLGPDYSNKELESYLARLDRLKPCPVGFNLIQVVYAAEDPCKPTGFFQTVKETLTNGFNAAEVERRAGTVYQNVLGEDWQKELSDSLFIKVRAPRADEPKVGFAHTDPLGIEGKLTDHEIVSLWPTNDNEIRQLIPFTKDLDAFERAAKDRKVPLSTVTNDFALRSEIGEAGWSMLEEVANAGSVRFPTGTPLGFRKMTASGFSEEEMVAYSRQILDEWDRIYTERPVSRYSGARPGRPEDFGLQPTAFTNSEGRLVPQWKSEGFADAIAVEVKRRAEQELDAHDQFIWSSFNDEQKNLIELAGDILLPDRKPISPCKIGFNLIPIAYAAEDPCKPTGLLQQAGQAIEDLVNGILKKEKPEVKVPVVVSEVPKKVDDAAVWQDIKTQVAKTVGYYKQGELDLPKLVARTEEIAHVDTPAAKAAEAALVIDDKFASVRAITGDSIDDIRLTFGVGEYQGWLRARVTAKAHDGPLTADFIKELHQDLSEIVNPEIGGKFRTSWVKGGDYTTIGAPGKFTPEQVEAIKNNPLLDFEQIGPDPNTGKILYPSPSLPSGRKAMETLPPEAIVNLGPNPTNSQLVEALLDDLARWYNAEVQIPGHDPYKLAAELQQKLISIHPFGDYNGRLSKVLMDWSLERDGLAGARLEDPGNDIFMSLADWTKQIRQGSERQHALAETAATLEKIGITPDSATLLGLDEEATFYNLVYSKLGRAPPPVPKNPGEGLVHPEYEQFLTDLRARMDIFKELFSGTRTVYDDINGHPVPVKVGGLIPQSYIDLVTHKPKDYEAYQRYLIENYYSEVPVYRGGVSVDAIQSEQDVLRLFEENTAINGSYYALGGSSSLSTARISDSRLMQSLQRYNALVAHDDLTLDKALFELIKTHTFYPEKAANSPFASTSIMESESVRWAINFDLSDKLKSGILFEAKIPKQGAIFTFRDSSSDNYGIWGFSRYLKDLGIDNEVEVLVPGNLNPASIDFARIYDRNHRVAFEARKIVNEDGIFIEVTDSTQKATYYKLNPETGKYEPTSVWIAQVAQTINKAGNQGLIEKLTQQDNLDQIIGILMSTQSSVEGLKIGNQRLYPQQLASLIRAYRGDYESPYLIPRDFGLRDRIQALVNLEYLRNRAPDSLAHYIDMEKLKMVNPSGQPARTISVYLTPDGNIVKSKLQAPPGSYEVNATIRINYGAGANVTRVAITEDMPKDVVDQIVETLGFINPSAIPPEVSLMARKTSLLDKATGASYKVADRLKEEGYYLNNALNRLNYLMTYDQKGDYSLLYKIVDKIYGPPIQLVKNLISKFK